MKKHYEPQEWDELRNKIIGLGENSVKRSYYPELQNKLLQLEKFRTLLDNFVDGIIVLNLSEGIVEDANKSAFNLIPGLKLHEEIDTVLRDLIKDDLEKLYDKSRSIKEEKIDNLIFDTNVMINSEPHAYQFRISVRKFGGVPYAVIYLSDITERNRYEQKIAESEEQLRKIIEGSPVGICVLKESKIYYANSTALSIFGFKDLSDVKDRNIEDFLIKKDKHLLDEILVRSINGTYLSEKLEITGLSADKAEIPLFVNITNIELIDGMVFVVFFDDATKQKEAENALIFAKTKAEESERLKSEFLAQMSHEIRTPISTILNFSNLINDELHNLVSDDLKNSFDIIKKAGDRIIRTIDLILNMSEMQVGTYEKNTVKLNLFNQIISSLVKENLPKTKAKNIELIVADNLPNIEILGDEYTIDQIFANLIDNAIKYTEKGYVKIYSEYSENNGYSIIVEDSGIGISDEYLPSLFNPFSQEERGYTRKYEGNGLGLALVKKYCELNKINISVDSKKNHGSKFKLTFNKIEFVN
jgi:PAS domain S-box-containing protein